MTDVSAHGIFAQHPERVDLPVLVAPSQDQEKNTIRYPLIVVACAQLPDNKFAFDSSFIAPDVTESMGLLSVLVRANAGCPLSIFGHADPVGTDDYNKSLSGRRAAAVYGMLIRDPNIWEDIDQNKGVYTRPLIGDQWGTRAIQMMLIELRLLAPEGASGQMDAATNQAVQAFQSSHKDVDGAPLAVDGDPGTKTRKALYKAYMDSICTDDQNKPFILQKDAFLARGLGDHGKGDYQGCSKFNPVLLFSQEEEQTFQDPAQKQARDQANKPNRRVLAYLFKQGSQYVPDKWPCPKAKEDATGCYKRFWWDHAARTDTHLPNERREFSKTEDTMACRFYHQFAKGSPCEDTVKIWVIRLRVHGPNGKLQPLAKRAYVVTAGEEADAAAVRGMTDDDGMLSIPVFDEVTQMTLKVDAWNALAPQTDPAGGSSGGNGSGSTSSSGSNASSSTASGQPDPAAEAKYMVLTLNAGSLLKVDDGGDTAAKERLYNLGYGRGDYHSWDQPTYTRYLQAFQKVNSLSDQSGTLTSETQQQLKTQHGS